MLDMMNHFFTVHGEARGIRPIIQEVERNSMKLLLGCPLLIFDHTSENNMTVALYLSTSETVVNHVSLIHLYSPSP